MSQFDDSLEDVLESHMEEFGESTGVTYGYPELANSVPLWAILGKINTELIDVDEREVRAHFREITISAIDGHVRYGGVANVRDDGWFDVANDKLTQRAAGDIVRWSIVRKTGSTNSFHTFLCKLVRLKRSTRPEQRQKVSVR